MIKANPNSDQTKWAVIGGGNGGQSLAGHLALMGFGVRLYDIIPETLTSIELRGGIEVSGAVEGFGILDIVTGNIQEAISGADIVMIVAPANAHRAIAQACAPYLEGGQLIFIHPGATGGALEFKKVLADVGCKAEIILSESNSLLYACRCSQPGRAEIFGIKRELMVAALPATRTARAVSILQAAFPQLVAGTNVLETSFGNMNALMHPAPTLLNTSMIESGRDWHYYWDGITPSIGGFVEKLDRERINIGKQFGLSLTPVKDWYERAYDAKGDTLSEAVKNNDAYEKVSGQKTLRTRYLLEDIPTGLVPMVSLGKIVRADTTLMELVIQFAESLLEKELVSTGRTLENLGLAGMSSEEILKYIQ